MPRKRRKLEEYQINGSINGRAINYSQTLQRIAAIPARNRVLRNRDRVLALRAIEVNGDVVVGVILEGDQDDVPLIYDTQSAAERDATNSLDEVVVHKTHFGIRLSKRKMLIEYNQRGAKAADVAVLLEFLAQRGVQGGEIVLTINPIAEPSLLDAIDRFDRVRVARLQLARPNPGWTDQKTALMETGNASNARTITLEATAPRNGTLSKIRGIVANIRAAIRAGDGSVNAVQITGVREGEEQETSVSLRKFIKHRLVSVETVHGQIPSTVMFDHLTAALLSEGEEGD